jgi:pyruvate formate lyase activating enzyme
MGRYMTAGEVFKEVMKDKIFFEKSGGGVTLGGGEPLASPEFAESILRLCKNAGLHTALDTCGYAKWETMRQVLNYVDLVLYDLKHMDPVAHQTYTGVSNDLILDNIKRIHVELSIPILVRIPIIPGYNDSIKNITATANFVASELGTATDVHLLPYHRLGETKYQRLEKPGIPVSIDTPSEAHVTELMEVFKSFNLNVHAGG